MLRCPQILPRTRKSPLLKITNCFKWHFPFINTWIGPTDSISATISLKNQYQKTNINYTQHFIYFYKPKIVFIKRIFQLTRFYRPLKFVELPHQSTNPYYLPPNPPYYVDPWFPSKCNMFPFFLKQLTKIDLIFDDSTHYTQLSISINKRSMHVY